MKKISYSILVVALASISLAFVDTTTQNMLPYHGRSIVFYNVENLFDTINQPDVIDEDFLPTGKLKWNTKRYQLKLNHIVEALTVNLAENPLMIGLVEVENDAVVMDVAKTGRLANTNYQLVHKNSPDARGIDCALLVDASRFKVLTSEFLTVAIDSIPNFKTRDILYVKGQLAGNKTVHVFVNHWPSRRGGEKESEIRRVQAATVARKKINEILAQDPKANILLMGDFNDHPTDKSMNEVLGAKQLSDKFAQLYNLLYDDHLAGKGTHSYQGKWGVLDQFVVSKGLFTGKSGVKLSPKDATIVYEEKLLFTQKDGNKKPSTTYGGDNYYGGYSDHLPIQLRLK